MRQICFLISNEKHFYFKNDTPTCLPFIYEQLNIFRKN